MRKQETIQKPLVTYVRIRELYRSFLNYKYSDVPIDLPVSGCALYDILSVGIVPNYRMGNICYSSLSQAAYDFAFNGCNGLFLPDGSCTSPSLPKPEDKDRFVPFIMPRTVIIGGRRLETDKWFQLSSSAYRLFSAQVEDEFWAAYIKHDQRYNLYCYRKGLKYNQELSMEKFMQMVGMDFNLEDNFARYWRKKKQTDGKLFDHYSNKDSSDCIRRKMGVPSYD